MIKKVIIILLILISLTTISCNNKINNAYNINTTVFVDSIGIDYNKESKLFTLYYHSPSSFSLITSEMGSGNIDNTFHIAKAECISIEDGIKKIASNTEKNILLTHVKSIIFSENFITIENIIMFNNFIKTYKYITNDFAVYGTNDDIKTLFSFKNPDNNSYFSILTELDEVIPYKTIKYYEFANSIVEPYIPIIIQWIKLDDNIWSDNSNKLISLHLEGIYLLQNDNLLKISSNEYKFIHLLFNNYYTIINVSNTSYNLINTKIKINNKRVKITSDIFATNITNKNQEQIISLLKESLIEEFDKLFQYTVRNNIDLFYIKDHLYRRGKLTNDFSLNDLQFEYEIKLKLLN